MTQIYLVLLTSYLNPPLLRQFITHILGGSFQFSPIYPAMLARDPFLRFLYFSHTLSPL
jgi:hypothetical protein